MSEGGEAALRQQLSYQAYYGRQPNPTAAMLADGRAEMNDEAKENVQGSRSNENMCLGDFDGPGSDKAW